MTAEKLRGLGRCAEAGVSVSLAAAIERGINEHELGAIIRFGIEHPSVTGVRPASSCSSRASSTIPLEA